MSEDFKDGVRLAVAVFYFLNGFMLCWVEFLPAFTNAGYMMLAKYVEYGAAQFQIPEILKVPPISERGTVPQIAAFFGGAEKMRAAVGEMQALLYAS